MECPKCHKTIPESATVCPHCRKVLSLVCPNCHTQSKQSVCPKCGYIILEKCAKCGRLTPTTNSKCKCGFDTAKSIANNECETDEFAYFSQFCFQISIISDNNKSKTRKNGYNY